MKMVRGKCFDSSSGFTLPNGATRSPDAAWIRQERWNGLAEEEKASFCPDLSGLCSRAEVIQRYAQ